MTQNRLAVQSESVGSPPLTHSDIRSIIIGVLVAMFLAALDQTIVATAMPTIGRDLSDFEHLPWVVTAYLLAATAVTPLYGKVSDIAGRRVTLLVAIGVFVLGSIICALPPAC
jgi:MFS family permease